MLGADEDARAAKTGESRDPDPPQTELRSELGGTGGSHQGRRRRPHLHECGTSRGVRKRREGEREKRKEGCAEQGTELYCRGA